MFDEHIFLSCETSSHIYKNYRLTDGKSNNYFYQKFGHFDVEVQYYCDFAGIYVQCKKVFEVLKPLKPFKSKEEALNFLLMV